MEGPILHGLEAPILCVLNTQVGGKRDSRGVERIVLAVTWMQSC
jgi:hypothetical protein